MNNSGALKISSDNVRVMLVEDSAVVRGMVRGWLEGMDGIEVVAAADNGQVALDRVAAARPDIIILDIEMPVMDGLTALPGLLRAAPGARILIASTLSRRNAEITLQAMRLGATDYLEKPSFSRDGNDARARFRDELVGKITALAGLNRPVPPSRPAQTVPVSLRPAAKPGASISQPHGTVLPGTRWGAIPPADTKFSLRRPSRVRPKVLAIGSSTGGPAALSRLMEQLKGKLEQVPVLLTQHMPPTFTTLLGESLCRLGGLKGGEAEDGAPVVPGHLYVAPGGWHMRLVSKGEGVRVALDDGPPINHCRPAVDPMFESLAEIYGGAVLGLILTGMGSDGAAGAVRIADRGGSVLAQDEKSSIVWGMPGAAMAAGACIGAVPLEAMAQKITAMLNGKVM